MPSTRLYPLFDEPVPDGVHLGMTHHAYFRQETRGSSDWTEIDLKKEGWWWRSPYNRRRRLVSTAAQTRGSALHAVVLEGIEAYERQFAIKPSEGDYDGLVRTTEEMKLQLEKAGFDVITGKSKWKQADWAQEMWHKLPDVPCWPNILKDYEAGAGQRQSVSADDDWQMRFMREMVLSPDRNDNAEMRLLLSENDDHPALVEVSVFATIDGIRRRWRIDRLFPALNADLKSLGPWNGRPLNWEVGDVLARRRWSIQRYDYDVGRRVAYEMVKRGRIFGGSLEQRRYLERIVAEQDKWDWLWLIYQLPDPVKGTAPIIMPVWDDWDSELARAGAAKLENAIRFYRQKVAEFGLEEPWGRVEPLHYTRERSTRGGTLLPSINVPHYAFEIDAPTEAGAYERDPE